MKFVDIIENELLSEMAAIKNPEAVAELIKQGDMDAAVEQTVSKSTGKPLKSVAANIKELLSPEEVSKYRAALQSTRPTAKRGPGKKAAESKKDQLVDTATGKKSGKTSTSTASQKSIKDNLEKKLRRTAQQVIKDAKLSDEEKESSLAALEIMGEALQASRSGKGVLPSGNSVSEQARKIARNKLAKDDPNLLEEIKRIEEQLKKEAAEDEEEAKAAAEKFKKETGKTPDQAIDDAIAKGLLRMRADSTVPKDEDDETPEGEVKEKKSLRDQIIGNSRSNK